MKNETDKWFCSKKITQTEKQNQNIILSERNEKQTKKH